MKKKVVLISTGGTIASGVNPETGLLTSGMMTGEDLAKQCELPTYIELNVETLFHLPSNEMTFDHLIQLKEKIEKVFENQEVAGVVVTHGTDTLEETTYFLDLTIGDERPIVVTGAQRSPDTIGTDAFSNLRQAIILAASEEARSLGTVVLFNEKILPARYVKKNHASNVDGFNAPEFGNLGYVDEEEIILYSKAVKKETYELKSALPYVEIIKCSLGSDGRLIKYAVDIGAKGIVIEAFGRGQVHPAVSEQVQYAIEKGVIVVVTTSTAEGHVKVVYDTPGTAYDLQKKGAILGRDYDSKKARMKLAVMLAAGVEDIKERF
jgi:L-asparaginase